MFEYYFETNFNVVFKNRVSLWIKNAIREEGFIPADVSFIFCDDEMLLEKNIRFLNHNTLTDVIGFDYTEDNKISGDIFISVDAVKRNAEYYEVEVKDEIHRVMIHAILHFCGYKDDKKSLKKEMRAKENHYLALRNF